MTKEDDRTRDCLLLREDNQRQEEKTTLKTLLRTSPLLGTRLVSLPTISFFFSLSCPVYVGLIWFSSNDEICVKTGTADVTLI